MPTWDEVMAAPPAGRRRLLKLLSALLAVLAVCAALWPFAIQWASGARLSREAAAATAAHVPATAVDRRDLKAARAYNARLARCGNRRNPGGQGVAGSNPAGPTKKARRSAVFHGIGMAGFSLCLGRFGQ